MDIRTLGERISEGMRFMWGRRKRAERLWNRLPWRLQRTLTDRGLKADDLLDARWRDLQRIPGVGPIYAQKIMEAKDD